MSNSLCSLILHHEGTKLSEETRRDLASLCIRLRFWANRVGLEYSDDQDA